VVRLMSTAGVSVVHCEFITTTSTLTFARYVIVGSRARVAIRHASIAARGQWIRYPRNREHPMVNIRCSEPGLRRAIGRLGYSVSRESFRGCSRPGWLRSRRRRQNVGQSLGLALRAP
jgi:hypothetical protein